MTQRPQSQPLQEIKSKESRQKKWKILHFKEDLQTNNQKDSRRSDLDIYV